MPGDSVEVVNVATPPALTAEVSSAVVPSKNVIVPVGVPVVEELTVAVKVTDCPIPEGFTEEIRTVLVSTP